MHPKEAEVRAWLDERGVKYLHRSTEVFPLELIDEKASRANQARPMPVIDEAVETFATALRNGAVFPPIVVYFPAGGTKPLSQLVKEKSKAVIVDGNNREAAHKKVGRSEIWTIILDPSTSSEMIQRLTVSANAMHGNPVAQDWRVRQAIHLHKGCGWPMEIACAEAVVSKNLVTIAMSVQKATERAKELGVKAATVLGGKKKGFADLPTGTRYQLAQIKDDVPFIALCQMVLATAMTGEELRVLMKELKALTSEAERIDLIKKTAEDRAMEAAARATLGRGIHKISSPKHTLASGLGKIMAVEPAEVKAAILTLQEKAELMERLRRAADRILEHQIAVEGALLDGVA